MFRMTRFFSQTAPLAILLTGACAATHDKKQDKPQPPAGAPSAEMAMDEFMDKPGPEQAMLRKDVGNWDASFKMWMDPKQPPMESKATYTSTMFGDFWLQSEYKGDFMGKPFVGHDLLGYDLHRKKFIGSWCDNTSSQMMIFEGTYDPATRTLTTKSEMMDPMNPGHMVKFTNKTVWKSDDLKIYTAHEDHGEGKEWDGMVIEFTRSK